MRQREYYQECVPNTGGLHGLEAAAAAGIVAGDPDRKLLVISQVTKEKQTQIAAFLRQGKFIVRESDSGALFDICITLTGGGHQSSCRIAEEHANIVCIQRDGETVYSHDLENTICNVSRVASEGMRKTDAEIIKIMLS